MKETQLKLDLEDAGNLRDLAMIQIEQLREIKCHEMPIRSDAWWVQLNSTINDPVAIDVLKKKATDSHDQHALEALGILQIWALDKYSDSMAPQWSPLLARVSACPGAAKVVVQYLVHFNGQRECGKELNDLLIA